MRLMYLRLFHAVYVFFPCRVIFLVKFRLHSIRFHLSLPLIPFQSMSSFPQFHISAVLDRVNDLIVAEHVAEALGHGPVHATLFNTHLIGIEALSGDFAQPRYHREVPSVEGLSILGGHKAIR